MSEAIAVALIMSGLGLLGTIITVMSANKKTTTAVQAALEKSQAVTETRLGQLKTDVEELKSDVRAHNEYGRRIPVLEERTTNMMHRIEEIEQKVS